MLASHGPISIENIFLLSRSKNGGILCEAVNPLLVGRRRGFNRRIPFELVAYNSQDELSLVNQAKDKPDSVHSLIDGKAKRTSTGMGN